MVAISPTAVWRASLDDLDSADWATDAAPAEMPTVGGQYDFTLLTHCGPLQSTLNFDRRAWVPDLPEGFFPLTFDYFHEPGTIRYVASDRLEFTGSKGDVVTYLPTHGGPHSFPCH